MNAPPGRSEPRWPGAIWLLVALASLAYGVGDYALIDPDEGRNAVIAQEMASTGDFLAPRINGLPFMDKPFLYFSFGAVSIRLLGNSELAVRLPSVVCGWAMILLTAWFSSRLFGRDTAWVAGVACATTALTVVFSRTVIFDIMLSLFVLAALVCFYLAIEGEQDAAEKFPGRRGWTALAWVAIAFGVFTKGPVALLLPLLIVVPYSLWRRRAGTVFHPAGWCSFLVLIVPWLAMTERAVPGFLRYALVTETWQRLTTDVMERNAPAWYFLPIMVLGLFPWSILALASGRRMVRAARAGSSRPALIFLALWILLPLIFFSFSHSKRVGYVLPLVPAVALLVAWSWTATSRRWPGARAAAAGWLLLAVVFLAVRAGAGRIPEHLETVIARSALLLGASALGAAIAGWLLAERRRLAPMALSLPLVLLPGSTAPLANAVAESRSGKGAAAAIREQLTSDTAFLGVETYSPSLAYYLDRPIEVSSSTGRPFRTNYIEYAYPSLVGTGSAGLQAAQAWRGAVAACGHPLVVLLKSSYEVERLELESMGLPLVYVDRKLTLLGPCRSRGLTSRPAMVVPTLPEVEGRSR
jgi:4-amino-4-deoxy-L-arabinose transferase-like glycosyltransferase